MRKYYVLRGKYDEYHFRTEKYNGYEVVDEYEFDEDDYDSFFNLKIKLINKYLKNLNFINTKSLDEKIEISTRDLYHIFDSFLSDTQELDYRIDDYWDLKGFISEHCAFGKEFYGEEITE